MTYERAQHSRAWVATIILAMAALVSTADKTLPSLLMEPIKQAMSLSDMQIGLLTGFTFAVAMSLTSLPLAWVADRTDRVILLAVAMTVWCLLTVASSFSHSFTILFLTRLGVGIGEAALMPAALSLVGDLFPLGRVTRANAVFTYAGNAGGFVALSGGGWLYGYFRATAMPGHLNALPADAWRWTTLSFGVAGLIVTVLVALLVPEPRRAQPLRQIQSETATGLTSYLRQAMPFLVPFLLCFSAAGTFAYGFAGWLAPFFSRNYSWSIGQVGHVVGVVYLVASFCAPAIGFLFNSVLRSRLGREAPIMAICALLAVALPFMAIGPLLSSGLAAAVAIGTCSA